MVNVSNDVYTVRQVVGAAVLLKQWPMPKGYEQVLDLLKSNQLLPLDRADEIIEHLHRNLVFKSLRNTLKDFERQVMALLGEPTQSADRWISVLMRVPDMYDRLLITENLAEVTVNSQYQGTLGQLTTKSLVVMRCDYIENYGFYAATAVDEDGNAFGFCPKFQLVVGEVINIRGKIKTHKVDTYNNDVPTTYLNYVKFL